MTSDPPPLLDELDDEIDRVVSLLRPSVLTQPVPTCPGWTVGQLGDHLGQVYSYASAILAAESSGPPDRSTLPRRPEDESVSDWVERRGRDLLRQLGELSRSDLRWNFLAGKPSPVDFWPRRMLHETVIHRVDAALATTSPVAPLSPALAADGVSEFLLLARHLEVATSETGATPTQSVHLHATDAAGAEWSIDVEGRRFSREHRTASVAVRGPAWSLHRWCWGRLSGDDLDTLEFFGDEELADRWRPLL